MAREMLDQEAALAVDFLRNGPYHEAPGIDQLTRKARVRPVHQPGEPEPWRGFSEAKVVVHLPEGEVILVDQSEVDRYLP